MCSALLHEKIVIYKKFKLAGDYMRNFTKYMPTELINIHYNFNDINSKNDKRCEKLNESLFTELLDMHNREWQHIGYKEQFKILIKNFVQAIDSNGVTSSY